MVDESPKTIEFTFKERALLSFALGCHIEDREREAKRRKFGVDHPYCQQVADIQRLQHKIHPESLCGDLVLADGTVLRKEG